MIRKDKDRHAESTKQKAAFVFPSEETPSCLWSEPLLKSEIAARVHHSPPESLYLSLRTNASSKTCSCVSPGARTDIQINKSTHALARSRKISCGNLVLLLSGRNEEPVSCWQSSDASSVCTKHMKKVLAALNRMPREDFIYHTLTHALTSSGVGSMLFSVIVYFCHFRKQCILQKRGSFISVQDLREHIRCHHLVFSTELQQNVERTIQGELSATYCHYLKQKCLPGSSFLNVKNCRFS